MSSTIGEKIRVSIFGQSHGEAIGAVVDGLQAGEKIDEEVLAAFMARRAPGKALSTARREQDRVRILSGLAHGVTCGAPLALVIENTDQHSADYDLLRRLPRPGHADYPAHVKWQGMNDVRGGGHFSARLTAPLCAVGGILMQIYERRGIFIGAHLASVCGVKDTPFDPMNVTADDFALCASRYPAVMNQAAGEEMMRAVAALQQQGNSGGGVVECAVLGLPVGLGSPIFDGLENRIAKAVFGIPAVKGIEFGEGFSAAGMTGFENNDPYTVRDGRIELLSNHAGGILGGLSNGAPLVFRAAFKPTPSIAAEQRTVDLKTMEPANLRVGGRHDPCVALRAVPCVEAACAVALCDEIL